MYPIRVLQVFGKMNRAGAETFIMNVYRNIDKSKIQFDFLVYSNEIGDYDHEIQQLGGKIYRLPPLKIQTLYKFKKSLNLFFQNNPHYSIIHSHLDTLSSFYLKAAKKAGIPVRIAHSHTSNIPLELKAVFRIYSKQFINFYATHKFACSKNAYKWLFREDFIKSESNQIVNNGIEIKKFLYKIDLRTKIRKDLNLEDKFVIGCVGKFTKTKNHKFLLEIFKDIQKKEPNSILVLIGTGALKKSIQEKAKNLGVDENILFLGSRNDVNELLQALDVLVLPSLYEGFPVTLVEAQAASLPCVVSNVITNEVELTDLIKFVGLDDPVGKWSKEILNVRNKKRSNKEREIIEKGFDIKNVARCLETFFINNN